MAQESPDCLSENELLAWAAGSLPRERIQALDAHVDGCEQCQSLVAEATPITFFQALRTSCIHKRKLWLVF